MLSEKDIPALLIEFRDLFPEFKALTDTKVNLFLGEALQIHSVRKSVALYVAGHFAQVDGQGASGSPLRGTKSETVGPMSVSYLTQTMDGDPRSALETTPYGQKALLLESRTPSYRFAAFVT